MKVISKEEEEAHYKEVLKGGFIGGGVSLALGIAGVYAASRRYRGFAGLTLPFRSFLVTSTATCGAIIWAERYSIAFQKAQDPMNFYKGSSQRALEEAKAQEGEGQKLIDWCRENRYTIVLSSWVASMFAAGAIVSRNKYLSGAQKLVQARVYAQGLTLAVLIATAAFETHDARNGTGRWETVLVVDPNDPEHKHLIEKRIHKEEYQGQDLWKDMVAAEERRLEARKQERETAEAKAAEAKPGEAKAN
ncbi:Replication factor C, subunit RFC4 [Cytospora paraplurivora]|uniref:Replication factor C, subunit RFC4 n=1 Tax=Cytospora paraplurivora TaxID=2898453 RepID=A0AAN9UHJ7_9PEZI